MPSSQGYQKVASEPPIDPVDVGGTTGSNAQIMPGGNVNSGSAMVTGTAGGVTGAIQSNPAGKIPATNSQQRLMPTDSDSVSSSMDMDEGDIEVAHRRGHRHEDDSVTVTTTSGTIGANAWFTVGVLCFVNLINYMDRFTIAEVLLSVGQQEHWFREKGSLFTIPQGWTLLFT
uniref:Major facilitator superfamily (MFS) profile domain-containing protein n=1 Tax=Anopheles atroparvus TaxID=41427 RepID=A0A182IPV5_ANOAO